MPDPTKPLKMIYPSQEEYNDNLSGKLMGRKANKLSPEEYIKFYESTFPDRKYDINGLNTKDYYIDEKGGSHELFKARIDTIPTKTPTITPIQQAIDNELRTTAIPNITPVAKDKRRYTAGDYLESQGKPSGYINMGDNTGRKEFANGGIRIEDPNPGMTGMMKARIALDSHFGNPAAQRMTSPNPKTGMTPEGLGTHYMASMDEYAVPLLQDKGGKNLEYNENPNPSSEDMKFNSAEDAEYFAKHYKEVAPMMYANGGVRDGDPTKPYVTSNLEDYNNRTALYNDSLYKWTGASNLLLSDPNISTAQLQINDGYFSPQDALGIGSPSLNDYRKFLNKDADSFTFKKPTQPVIFKEPVMATYAPRPSYQQIPTKQPNLQSSLITDEQLTPTYVKNAIEYPSISEFTAKGNPMIDAKRTGNTVVPQGEVNYGDNKGRKEFDDGGVRDGDPTPNGGWKGDVNKKQLMHTDGIKYSFNDLLSKGYTPETIIRNWNLNTKPEPVTVAKSVEGFEQRPIAETPINQPSTRGEAFKQARAAGEKKFTYEGKRYTTELASDKKVEGEDERLQEEERLKREAEEKAAAENVESKPYVSPWNAPYANMSEEQLKEHIANTWILKEPYEDSGFGISQVIRSFREGEAEKAGFLPNVYSAGSFYNNGLTGEGYVLGKNGENIEKAASLEIDRRNRNTPEYKTTERISNLFSHPNSVDLESLKRVAGELDSIYKVSNNYIPPNGIIRTARDMINPDTWGIPDLNEMFNFNRSIESPSSREIQYGNGGMINHKDQPPSIIDFYSPKAQQDLGFNRSYPYRTKQNPSYKDIQIDTPTYHDDGIIHSIGIERRFGPSNIQNDSSMMYENGGVKDGDPTPKGNTTSVNNLGFLPDNYLSDIINKDLLIQENNRQAAEWATNHPNNVVQRPINEDRVDYPSTDVRSSNYAGNPNWSFAAPNMTGKQRADAEQYHGDIIGGELLGLGVERLASRAYGAYKGINRNRDLSKALSTDLDGAVLNPDLIEGVLPKVKQSSLPSSTSSDNLILDSKKIKAIQDDIDFTQKAKELQSKVPLTRVVDKSNLVVKDGKLFNSVEPYTVMTGEGLTNTTSARNTSHWSYGHVGDPGHGNWKGKSTAVISDYETLSKKGYALDLDPTDTFFYNSKNMELPEGSLILTRDKKLYDDIIKNTNQKNVKYFPSTTNDEFESIVNSYSKREGDERGIKLFEEYLEKNWKEGKDIAHYKPTSNYKPVQKNVYNPETGMYYQVEDSDLRTIGSPFGGGSSKMHSNSPLYTIEKAGNYRLSKDVFDLYPDSSEFKDLLAYPKELQLSELEKYKSLKRRKSGSKSIAELENAMAKNSGFDFYSDFKKSIGEPLYKNGGIKSISRNNINQLFNDSFGL